MLSHSGHALQQLINKTPVAVSANSGSSVVVTNGGSVLQAGLVSNKIQPHFKEILANSNIVGRVVDAKAAENSLYVLSDNGSVFRYDYNAGNPSCNPHAHEVYIPAHCGGDKAVKIAAGRAHVLILTAECRVFGAGDNSQYQLVPQGQCFYGCAVEILVGTTINHDNNCAQFGGIVNPPADQNTPPAQPKWTDISAGGDISALVDSCNRIYVLGDLHKIRNNKALLQRSGLAALLDKTSATVTMPASQLNCNTNVVNDDCKCSSGCDKTVKTDLSKIGVAITFNNNTCDDNECNKNVTLCQFLSDLQAYNENPACENTCKPCDGYIHLDLTGIQTISLWNKVNLCRRASIATAGPAIPLVDPPVVVRNITANSYVTYDNRHICIDGVEYELNEFITLNVLNAPPGFAIQLYLDVCQAGGVLFDGLVANATVLINPAVTQVLNYGCPLDPAILANLKYALGTPLNGPFQCLAFSNPGNILNSTYLQGGDIVGIPAPADLVAGYHAITADLPAVFRLTRRVLQVAVGDNNLSVLVGGLACPNEIFVLGENCHGELGLGSFETTLCWKQVNRCRFDCQVNGIFAGDGVTMYVTQSGRVYGAGKWKCLVKSNVPTEVKDFKACWKVRQLAITSTHIVALTSDATVLGLGDNSLGELGLGNTFCVSHPTPLPLVCHESNHGRRSCDGNKCDSKPCCDDCATGVVRYTRAKTPVKAHAYVPNNRASCCNRSGKNF